MRLFLAVMLYATVSSTMLPAEDVFTVVRVVDGDTLLVFDGENEQYVRLIGVECPETRRDEKARRNADYLGVSINDIIKAGESARRLASSICPEGSKVSLEYDKKTHDQYGRTLAYVKLQNGRFLNEALIKNGAALTTPQYPHRNMVKYDELERCARDAKSGFWESVWKEIEKMDISGLSGNGKNNRKGIEK